MVKEANSPDLPVNSLAGTYLMLFASSFPHSFTARLGVENTTNELILIANGFLKTFSDESGPTHEIRKE